MKTREEKEEIIRSAFLELGENFLARGYSLKSLEKIVKPEKCENFDKTTSSISSRSRKIIITAALGIFLAAIMKFQIIHKFVKFTHENRCLVPNNYFVWEFTRPLSSCDFCRNVEEVLILPNLTRKDFEPYGYSSRPIVVKEAALDWKARKIYNITFFREIYENIEDAYNTMEEECQFLQFKSHFENLRQVLEMSEKRALNEDDEDPWYVGWKNCHPEVLKIINRFYQPPHFLPSDAEIPATSYIFLGYEQGAVMHLDYIPRLMWQAQIVGRKTWTVAPTPECEDVCKSFNFSVGTGDILLLDTRIWYHGTFVDDGLFSLTITSEYG